uniref:Protein DETOXIFICATION n=1 Tax=Hordeum vulgare subsp. vulgare TaxID=112509 RepID=A0A8I6XPI6_HORVV
MAMVVAHVRYVWGHAYSSEEGVVAYVARMLLLILVANFFDGIQCVLSGVARGCGWQKMCALINLGAFYVVGVPAAYLIAFVLRAGGMGLWMGIICRVLVQVLLLMFITLCTDWHEEATKAKNRVFSSSGSRDRSICTRH